MRKWQKYYPPYEGCEPYLYFAFAEKDSKKAWRIMKILLKRGCRVWYCSGSAGSPQELLRRQKRSMGAELTLLLLTDALAADKDSKSRIMVNQKEQRPILCLHTDSNNRYLAMDLRESTPGIALYHFRKDAMLEDALVRGEGFTQKVMGKPVKVRSRWMKSLTGIFFLLTAVLLCGAFLLFRQTPEYEDSVSFSDSVIREAARTAAGGGQLTEEDLVAIQSIYLTELPERWEDLTMFPNLQQIYITQEAALEAEYLPIEEYRIVLIGGAS